MPWSCRHSIVPPSCSDLTVMLNCEVYSYTILRLDTPTTSCTLVTDCQWSTTPDSNTETRATFRLGVGWGGGGGGGGEEMVSELNQW